MVKRRWSLIASALLILIATFVPGWVPARVARAQLDEAQVLILNSYHQGLSWTDNVVAGILSELEPDEHDLQLYVEYMDTKRFSGASFDELNQRLYYLYREKYQNVELDVIIVSDNNALNFVLEYYDDLFPGVPVVFTGINFFEDEMLGDEAEHFTGVVEAVDMEATLDVALRLHPNTERIVVVNDATTTGEIHTEELRALMPRYEDRVEFEFRTDPDMPNLLRRLQALEEDTLVFLILLNRDRDGQFYSYEESIDLIARATDRPIYGVWDFYMGRGMVGGKLTNARSQGEAAGEMALRILQGESPTDIPILRESPNRYIFDYEQLERFEIGLGELPAGSEVVDRPLSFIEQYQGAFWPVAGVVTFLLVVIGIQVVNVGRRQSMVEALERSNVELAEVRDSLEERVTERTQALERRSEQLQTAAEVGQEAASIRDVDELLAHTVNLISERFGFYHVSIFLVDEQGKYAVLRAASSEGGRRMLARGHRLKAGFGIVGAVLERGEPRISLDVDEDVVWYDNPDLPETRSEMGVPLKTRDHIVGVLNVQSKEPGAFSEEDVFVLQTMAEQVALAIENARLFRESRRALQELQHLYGAQMREAWTRRASERPLAYRYSGVDVERLPAAASEPSSQEDGELKVDLPLRDFSIASVALQRPDETEWSQDEVALVKAVATQAALALDNARLLEETRQRAVRERVVREITENIRGAVSIEDAVRRGLEEMQRALGASELVARLGTERDLAVDEKGDGNEG